MPRETKTVRVASITGETMRFSVESWTKAQRPHTVDLLSNDGAGECSCKNWITQKWPAIRDRIGCPGTPATMCRHVAAARLYFLNRLLRQMAKDHTQPNGKR